jgi:hypothetical protein
MCSIDFDGDAWEAWSETPVYSARKPHRCNGCGLTIPPGASYLRVFYVGDRAQTERACVGCWAALHTFCEAHGVDSLAPGDLDFWLRDCIGENDDEEDVWRPVLAGLLRRKRWARAGGGR